MRISATDWIPGGFDGDDAVALSAMLKELGVDIVDVSTGQVWADDAPAYGRSFQTPYADRIRNEVDMPTIAVGAISSCDDVNTTILAGRADLCALGRPHLYDPYWTLHAAAEQGVYRREDWVLPYQAGSRRPVDGKLDVRRQPLRSFDPPSPSPTSAAGAPPRPAPALSGSIGGVLRGRCGRPSWSRASRGGPGGLWPPRDARGVRLSPGRTQFGQRLGTFVTPPCARHVDGPKTSPIGGVFGPSTWGCHGMRARGAWKVTEDERNRDLPWSV